MYTGRVPVETNAFEFDSLDLLRNDIDHEFLYNSHDLSHDI